jgi:hypothetical protein
MLRVVHPCNFNMVQCIHNHSTACLAKTAIVYLEIGSLLFPARVSSATSRNIADDMGSEKRPDNSGVGGMKDLTTRNRSPSSAFPKGTSKIADESEIEDGLRGKA